jgi:hypothetical protein
LTGTDEQGQPVLHPFEHSATAEPNKAEAKRRRKKPEEPEILF